MFCYNLSRDIVNFASFLKCLEWAMCYNNIVGIFLIVVNNNINKSANTLF